MITYICTPQEEPELMSLGSTVPVFHGICYKTGLSTTTCSCENNLSFSTFSLFGQFFKEGFSHLKKQIALVASSFLFSASLTFSAENKDGEKMSFFS